MYVCIFFFLKSIQHFILLPLLVRAKVMFCSKHKLTFEKKKERKRKKLGKSWKKLCLYLPRKSAVFSFIKCHGHSLTFIASWKKTPPKCLSAMHFRALLLTSHFLHYMMKEWGQVSSRDSEAAILDKF